MLGYHENRYYLRTRLTQSAAWGKHYEELWLQIRSLPGSGGTRSIQPGLRARYGQEYRLGSSRDHSVQAYEELLFNLAPASYGASRLGHLRLSALYAFPLQSKTFMQTGIRLQETLNRGGAPSFSYGPVFVLNYAP